MSSSYRFYLTSAQSRLPWNSRRSTTASTGSECSGTAARTASSPKCFWLAVSGACCVDSACPCGCQVAVAIWTFLSQSASFGNITELHQCRTCCPHCRRTAWSLTTKACPCHTRAYACYLQRWTDRYDYLRVSLHSAGCSHSQVVAPPCSSVLPLIHPFVTNIKFDI